MVVKKEIKKEMDYRRLEEKWVIYEDGKKVGETRQERGKQVTYDADGQKVSETRVEGGLLGEKFVTYDTYGQKVSETRYETSYDRGPAGEPSEAIYENGRKIGELIRKEMGFFDLIPTKVMREPYGYDVDLTRRGVRKQTTDAENTSYGGMWGGTSSGHYVGAQKIISDPERIEPNYDRPKGKKLTIDSNWYDLLYKCTRCGAKWHRNKPFKDEMDPCPFGCGSPSFLITLIRLLKNEKINGYGELIDFSTFKVYSP